MLKTLREQKNLTQEQLAEMCGVRRTTISMIEVGTNKPSIDLALKLAKTLDCTVEQLVGESDVVQSVGSCQNAQSKQEFCLQPD